MAVTMRCPSCTEPLVLVEKLVAGAMFECRTCSKRWTIMMSDAPDEESLQESPSTQAAWLAGAQKRLPIGTRVRVTDACDVEAYIGLIGVVRDYEEPDDDCEPGVVVEFDVSPFDGCTADCFRSNGESDDEIVKITEARSEIARVPCECCDEDPCIHADEVPDGWGEP